MTLAGSIKLRTFLLGVGAVALVGLGLTWKVGGDWLAERHEAARIEAEAHDAEVKAEAAKAQAAASAQAAGDKGGKLAGPGAARPFDATLIGLLGKPLGAEKKKDVVPGGPKVNVYQDAGYTSANRAKVDLDRDEKDDEKWTFKDGKITRQVSPGDNEQYPETWLWNGSGWTRTNPGAPGAPAAPGATSAAPGGRPVDADLMGWVGKNLGTDKIKDATSGKPYKINVYQDAGAASANRAKIDLDRDDKWDEKITFAADGIQREVAPKDDEVYTETYVWKDGAWVKR